MLKIGLSKSDTMEMRRRAGTATLVDDPADYVANFFMESMHKFSVIPVPLNKELLRIPNIRKSKVKEDYKEALIAALTRPRLGNLDKLFTRALANLEEGKDVFATPRGGILFIDWAIKNNYFEKFEIDTLLSLDEMGEINNQIQNKSFYPIATERLLKLFMLFYSKYLTEEEIISVSKFQNQLIYLDRQETQEQMAYGLDCIRKKNIEVIEGVLKKVKSEVMTKNGHMLPSINIFNKIEEEIGSLQKKMNSRENRFFREDFVKISGNEDTSDDFINRYIDAAS